MDESQQVYAVIGGEAYEGELFSSLKLFKNREDAVAYRAYLDSEDRYEYAYIGSFPIN